jgi:phosphopantothenoylcysteine decarboxylase/phosphopantothenate--cysteine ligase
MLSGKKVLLGITGSIAAYKSAFLVRLLRRAGAEVQVLMTPDAQLFISPLTLHTLSGREVLTSVATDQGWNNHVDLGLWADVMVIAPLTANTLSKLAHGMCDNMVSATYLSSRAPVYIAPAMDLDMWAHLATKRNIDQVIQDGVTLIPVGDGELASGLSGPGRMAEPEDIVKMLMDHFKKKAKLSQITAIVTAGPTYEDIDPVRFIGNRSSGKMGVAIAYALADRGAQVELIIGPNHLALDLTKVNIHTVRSAQEMADVSSQLWPAAQVAVLAAAVADFTPANTSTSKIKKGDQSEPMFLELVPTLDISKSLGAHKREDQISVGFALETDQEEENAKGKLRRKHFDFIVLNSLQDEGAGFKHDTNKVTFLFEDQPAKRLPLKLKTEIALDIVDQIEQLAVQKKIIK